ncbi:cytoskeleton-associated protein 2-like [Glandiceps talaboti]
MAESVTKKRRKSDIESDIMKERLQRWLEEKRSSKQQQFLRSSTKTKQCKRHEDKEQRSAHKLPGSKSAQSDQKVKKHRVQEHMDDDDDDDIMEKLEQWKVMKGKQEEVKRQKRRPPWKGSGILTPSSNIKLASHSKHTAKASETMTKLSKSKKSLFSSSPHNKVKVQPVTGQLISQSEMDSRKENSPSTSNSLVLGACEISILDDGQDTGNKADDLCKDLLTRKSVRFTSPVRRSPRLAIIKQPRFHGEEGTADTSGTSLDYNDKQLDMGKRLELWLAAKGKTPSKYSNVIKIDEKLKKKKKKLRSRRSMPAIRQPPVYTAEDEGPQKQYSLEAEDIGRHGAMKCGWKKKVMGNLDAMLNDCLTLIDTDCPVEPVKEWLSSVCGKNLMMLKCAKYWICKAKIIIRDSGNQHEVIDCFEMAIQHDAEPIEEIKAALVDFVNGSESSIPAPQHSLLTPTVGQQGSPLLPPTTTSLIDESCSSLQATHTPRPFPEPVDLPNSHLLRGSVRQSFDNDSNMENLLLPSSGIKYCVSKTPLFSRNQKGFVGKSALTPMAVVTPVRRSVRLEQSSATKVGATRSHDTCVNSLWELTPIEMKGFIYKPNKALEAEFDTVVEVDSDADY